jgi:hypothetical protein
MAADEPFLSRWSRRKTEARTAEPGPEPSAAAADAPTDPAPSTAKEALPPTDALTFDSDFTPFMDPEVADGVRQEALKALFRDPRFNVMDGLDTYIDDYSKPDPIPEGWMSQLRQVSRLGDFAGRQEAERAAREKAQAQAQAQAGVPQGQLEGASAQQAEAGEADRVAPLDTVSEPSPTQGTARAGIPIPEVGDSGT